MDQKKTIVMIGSSCIDEYYEMDHVPDLGDKAVLKFLEPVRRWAKSDTGCPPAS